MNKYIVYLVQAGDTGPVKIGYCRNLSKRVDSLQTGCWEQLIVRGQFEGLSLSQARAIEKSLHQWLDEYLIRGEWFKPKAMKSLRKAIMKNHQWAQYWSWNRIVYGDYRDCL